MSLPLRESVLEPCTSWLYQPLMLAVFLSTAAIGAGCQQVSIGKQADDNNSATVSSGQSKNPVGNRVVPDEGDKAPEVVPSPGAKSSDVIAKPAPNSDNRNPILIFLGGYSSCTVRTVNDAPIIDTRGQNLTQPFDATTANVQARYIRAPTTLLGCYTLDASQVTYTTSEAPGVNRTVPVPDLLNAVLTLVRKHPGAPLFIVGHSYGGWTAIDLAVRLPKSVEIVALVTLDPISRVNCLPLDVLAPADSPEAKVGCREAPADFGAAKLRAVASRAGSWNNFYQTSSVQLHSGPIAQAENVELTYSVTTIEAHRAVSKDPQVAAFLRKLVKNLP